MTDSEATGRSREAGSGDLAAARLQRWLTDYRPAMLAVARRYEGRAIRAEDIVQDAAVKAISLTGRVPKVERPRQWLRTITRHAALRAVTRRRRRAKLLMQGLEDPTVDLDREERVLKDWETDASLSERLGLVMDAVGSLRPTLREVVWLRLDGKQNDEIAKTLQITRATVRVRWHRAIKALRDTLVRGQKHMFPPTHPPTHPPRMILVDRFWPRSSTPLRTACWNLGPISWPAVAKG